MREVACNFAPVQFIPYPETGEFVNIGVVLSCPERAVFDFRFEQRKLRRVTGFFPELDTTVYKEGLKALVAELDRVQRVSFSFPADCGLWQEREHAVARNRQFRDMLRPREGIFRFGEPGTTLTKDPAATLAELFGHYVERQFTQAREHQEIMRMRLGAFLKQWHLDRYYRQERVGNERYHKSFPFVHCQDEKPVKAIKPLDLARDDSSQIYQYGDEWICAVNRLRLLTCLPKVVIFAVQLAATKECREAGEEICQELRRLSAVPVLFEDHARLRELAAVE